MKKNNELLLLKKHTLCAEYLGNIINEIQFEHHKMTQILNRLEHLKNLLDEDVSLHHDTEQPTVNIDKPDISSIIHSYKWGSLESSILLWYFKGRCSIVINQYIKSHFPSKATEDCISSVTNKAILPLAQKWIKRSLNNMYILIKFETIQHHYTKNSILVSKNIYIAIGVDNKGHKDVLGFWDIESSREDYGEIIVNDLINRGVKHILIACTNGLSGLSIAIANNYPLTNIQELIIPLIRSSKKNIDTIDKINFKQDLTRLYTASSKNSAASALDAFSLKWDKKYPGISKMWRDNLAECNSYFQLPTDVKKLIYENFSIDTFMRTMGKIPRLGYDLSIQNETLKLMYAFVLSNTRRWVGACHSWRIIQKQLIEHFNISLPNT